MLSPLKFDPVVLFVAAPPVADPPTAPVVLLVAEPPKPLLWPVPAPPAKFVPKFEPLFRPEFIPAELPPLRPGARMVPGVIGSCTDGLPGGDGPLNPEFVPPPKLDEFMRPPTRGEGADAVPP